MIQKMVKYWMFYKLEELYDDDTDKILPYAYTEHKSYAKRFMKERNMSRFYCKEKFLTISELSSLAYRNQGGILEEKRGKTKKDGHGTKLVNFSIIVTSNEKINITNRCVAAIGVSLWTNITVNPCVFKKDIQDALDIICYSSGYKMINSPNDSLCTFVDMQPDFLTAFIHYYSDILKK